MKKVVAILLTTLLLIGCISFALAESAVSDYHSKMTGTWKCETFFNVPSKSSPALYYLSFTDIQYPDGGIETEVSGGYPYSFSLVGDETGEVYLICYFKTGSCCARVYLSEDANTMLLVTVDGGQFVYSRVN